MKSKQQLTAIIVDDENKSRENLSILLSEYCPEVEVIGKSKSVQEGIQTIAILEPDLVFLDIQLDTQSGFDLLMQLEEVNFEVIFTTAYSEYAIQAIRHAALDYLLKPINIQDLQRAVSKAYQRKFSELHPVEMINFLQTLKNSDKSLSKLALPTMEGIRFINISKIIFMKAEGSYTHVFLEEAQNHLISKSLKEFDNLQSTNNFFRIHHSYLINLDKVDKYIKGDGGQVVMKNGVQLDVSKRRKHQFLSRMDY